MLLPSNGGDDPARFRACCYRMPYLPQTSSLRQIYTQEIHTADIQSWLHRHSTYLFASHPALASSRHAKSYLLKAIVVTEDFSSHRTTNSNLFCFFYISSNLQVHQDRPARRHYSRFTIHQVRTTSKARDILRIRSVHRNGTLLAMDSGHSIGYNAQDAVCTRDLAMECRSSRGVPRYGTPLETTHLCTRATDRFCVACNSKLLSRVMRAA